MLMADLVENVRVSTAGSLEELKSQLVEPFDLLVMDLRMPGMKGMRSLTGVVHRVPETPVVVISATESQADVNACMEAGVRGFIPKSTPAPEMLAILRRVLAGELYHPALEATAQHPSWESDDVDRAAFSELSGRQMQVLAEMAKGSTNKEIAAVLNISEHTVKTHIAKLFSVLKVNSRVECAQQARLMGVI